MLSPSGPIGEHPLVPRFGAIRDSSTARPRSLQKPLLVLLAMGRVLMAKPRLALCEDIEPALTNLLKKFGTRRVASAAETFWRLQEDGVWEVQAGASAMAAWKTKRPASRSLIGARAIGGLSESLDA